MKQSLEMNIKIHGKVSVGPKGQIVIPKEVRDLIGIKTGDDLLVITKFNKIIGMIKADDIQEFLKYLKKEIQENKKIKKYFG